jgi:hypothetical protein
MINSTFHLASVCLEDLAPSGQLVAQLIAVERPPMGSAVSVAPWTSSHQTHMSRNFGCGFP